MKKLIFFVSAIFLFTIISTGEAKVPDSKKILTGSFVDFSGKKDWSQQKWESQFQEMRYIGMSS